MSAFGMDSFVAFQFVYLQFIPLDDSSDSGYRRDLRCFVTQPIHMKLDSLCTHKEYLVYINLSLSFKIANVNRLYRRLDGWTRMKLRTFKEKKKSYRIV